MRHILISTGFWLLTASLATAQPASETVRLSAAGYTLAAVRCAVCHALDDVNSSPNRSAPSFPQIGLHWPGRTLNYRVSFVTSNGHYAMPARPLTPDERSTVAAYIREVSDRVNRDRGN